MNNEILLAHHYKGFCTTAMVEQDIKLIKKINTALNKYARTLKPQYIHETKNILLSLNNTINIKEGREQILYYIEDRFASTVKKCIKELRC